MKKNNVKFIFEISRSVFVASLATTVVFFGLEYFKTGLITNYFNYNFGLLITIISGTITASLISPDSIKPRHRVGAVRGIWFIILGVLVAALVANLFSVYNRTADFVSFLSFVATIAALFALYKHG
ncbi:hypothetical protein CL634_01660 [bacterium]|nr:hypothetical protein [bacterium]|tara:strand:- start:438 stop:815 length:378 start_codon:yes stop_codon:yes gene_type:complete